MVTLTRSRSRSARTAEPPAGEGVAKPAQGSWLRTHLALVAVLGVVLVAALGGGAYLVLSSSGGDDPGTGLAPVRPTARPTGAARTTRSGGPGATSPSASGSTGTGNTSGTTGDAGVTTTPSRDPFAPLAGDGEEPATTTTGSAGPTGAPTGAAGPTVTTRVTATRTATTTVAPTSLYLGLYGWAQDGLPLFRLNDVPMSPKPGALLATGLVYVGKYTSGSETCANLAYDYAPRSLCPGDVVKLR